jgi:fatty acid desaturase
MDDRIRMNENGTLYLDFTEQEQPEQFPEIEASHGLIYYLLLAVIGIIVIFGILAIAFFGFLFLLLLPLFFGLLLLFLIARYFFWRSSER